MNSLLNLSASQLNHAADLQEKIAKLEKELASILGADEAPAKVSTKPAKRGMSAAGRAKIAAAQKARWAKVNAGKTPATVEKPAKKKRTMSPAAKAKIAAAQKARWAKSKEASK